MSESRHLRSVSDLYAADEIEVLLLEEIRDLEPPPAAYSRPEDIQDFEIAGSRTGGRISSQSSGLDSPGIHSTVHSWDSHANYHGSYGNGDHRHGSNAMAWQRTSHLILYCDIQGHLKTATGFVRLLLLVSSAACLVTLCSSGTAKISLFMLPLAGRLRFMIFVAVFSLLITALLLFLDISHVVHFFPFNWGRLNAWIFSSIGLSFITASTLLALSVFEYHGSGWVPRRTRSQLTATATLGLSCALLAFLLSWLHGRGVSGCRASPASAAEDEVNQQLYKPVDSSSSGTTLKDGLRSSKQPPPWVAKNSRKLRTSEEAHEAGRTSGKDHWASAREHFLGVGQPDEESSPLQQQQQQQQQQKSSEGETGRRQRRRREASGDEARSKKTPPRKLPIQEGGKPARAGRQAGAGKDGKDGRKGGQGTARTSVTRSEIQEYWMQGYEHVQRTERTTANIEQWQSAAMRSLEEKKAKDARWSEAWQRQKEQTQAQSRSQSQNQFPSSSSGQDDAKPCTSKTLEPLSFA
ncbi:uncharacterized protein LOC106651464 isoform X1 [Trichogramma pretiosum]|uniref:uncharacterized protein LOC106651464 isoform X1 n=1 Tax=Trichogramma pretiosum TaxID=7493 RepID=UPI0006C95169|nr:uncharacterized protein LOC106651464 isoform X1 [Trichogramma pretiosum]